MKEIQVKDESCKWGVMTILKGLEQGFETSQNQSLKVRKSNLRIWKSLGVREEICRRH